MCAEPSRDHWGGVLRYLVIGGGGYLECLGRLEDGFSGPALCQVLPRKFDPG